MNKVIAISLGILLNTFTAQASVDAFEKVIGVGIAIEKKSEKAFVVVEVIKNTPAAKSGRVAPGQMIIGIQPQPNSAWERPYGKTLEEVVNMIRGPAGTPVGLKVYNPADHATEDVILMREEIEVTSTNGGAI